MECMQKKAKSAITARASSTMTLRGIDPDLRAALDAEAARLGISLNAVILQELRGSLGLAGPDRLFHDLDHLAGTLSREDVEEFEAARKFFEQIDPELWDELPDPR